MSTTSDTLSKFDALPDAAYVDDRVVAALYGLTRSTIWRWTRAGLIPAPRKLGPQSTRWNVGELRAALASRQAA